MGQSPDNSHDDRLAAALEFFLESRETSQPMTRSGLISKFPELAEELQDCLDSLDFIEQTTGPAPATSSLVTGDLFGEYEIIREIARGGMGVVYEAFHLGLERRVALKVLSARRFGDQHYRTLFLREAKTAGSLHHTNIVPVFEVGELDGVCYYAMQFIEGFSLGQLVRWLRAPQQQPVGGSNPTTNGQQSLQNTLGDPQTTAPVIAPDFAAHPVLSLGPTGPEYFRTVASLVSKVASSLEYAHRRGVVHRDIKPSNIVLDKQGTPWIADFGLALGPEQPEGQAGSTPVGTPLYMSPEQASHEAIDKRTDIYSLGATLYELITLKPMFRGENSLTILTQITTAKPESPRSLNRKIPKDLEAIVLKATARSPDDRYHSAGEMAEDLQRHLEHLPIRARRIGPLDRLVRRYRREPRVAWVTAVACMIILTIVTVSHAVILNAKNRAEGSRDQAITYLNKSEQERNRAVAAESKLRQRQWEAFYQSARASLLSFKSGRRWQALDAIEQARVLRNDEDAILQLRNEAIQALSSTDARLENSIDIGQSITALKYSPDGKQLYFVARDGSVRVWDQSNPKSFSTVFVPEQSDSESSRGRWYPVAFSHCCRFIAVADPGTVNLWSTSRRELVAQLDCEDDESYRYLAFMGASSHRHDDGTSGSENRSRRKGTRLVAVNNRGHCLQWRIDGSSARPMETRELGAYVAIAVGPGNCSLTLLDAAGKLTIWDTNTWVRQEHETDFAPKRSSFVRIKWDSRGQILAVSSRPGVVELWNRLDNAAGLTLGGHRGRSISLAFSPDDRILATAGSGDAYLKLWDVSTGELIGTLSPSKRGTLSTAFSPSGKTVAAGGFSGMIGTWSIKEPKFLDQIAIEGTATALASDRTGSLIVVGTQDGRVFLLRRGARPPLRIELVADKLNNYSCASADISGDGRFAVTKTRDGYAHVWETETGELLAGPLRADSRGWFMRGGPIFLPDDSVVVPRGDGEVNRWDWQQGGEITLLHEVSGAILAAAVDGEAKRLATYSYGDSRQSLQVFDIESMARVADIQGLDIQLTRMTLTSNGTLLFIGDRNGNVHRIDITDRSRDKTWKVSNDSITSLAARDGGRQLVVGSVDGEVNLFAPTRGRIVARLKNYPGGAPAVACGHTGAVLSSGTDAQVTIWQIPAMEQELANLKLNW